MQEKSNRNITNVLISNGKMVLLMMKKTPRSLAFRS